MTTTMIMIIIIIIMTVMMTVMMMVMMMMMMMMTTMTVMVSPHIVLHALCFGAVPWRLGVSRFTMLWMHLLVMMVWYCCGYCYYYY